MGLQVQKPEGQDFVIIEEKLWLTADGSVVPDGHRDAVQLLATPGKRMSLADAVRYGLADDPNPKAEEAEEVAPESAEEPAVEVEPEPAVEAEEKPKRKRRTKAEDKSAEAEEDK